jgi:hypothetical protein
VLQFFIVTIMMHHVLIFIFYTARMAHTRPSSTVQVRDKTLDDYDGNLSDILRGILLECGCETRIPVKKYAYYEGKVF